MSAAALGPSNLGKERNAPMINHPDEFTKYSTAAPITADAGVTSQSMQSKCMQRKINPVKW